MPKAKNKIRVGSVVTISPLAVYGGDWPARGARVPAYITGAHRYTVGRISCRTGEKEALLAETGSWISLEHLTTA